MPDFSLSKRSDSPFWYVSFKNPYTLKYSTKKSTGTTDKKEATKIAYKLLFEEHQRPVKPILEALKALNLTSADAADIVEILDQKRLIATIITKDDAGAESFSPFLKRFWDYEKSPYVREKLHKNHGIHKKYVISNSKCVAMYWEPFFKDMPLVKLTKDHLNQFMDSLDQGLSGSRRNNIMKVGTVALKWAFKNQIITSDITAGIIWFSKDSDKRFIFTPEQAAQIFASPWKHETSRLANLVAMTTGLRAGEIMGLKKQDLGEDCIYVNHSWNNYDRQKTTKNNESRKAFIIFPEMMADLKKLADQNPYGEGNNGYVFWASIPGKPKENKFWLDDLRDVATKLGFGDIEKITFHGWRHFFATYMYTEVEEGLLQKATGHKTIEMLRHYANHDRDQDSSEIQGAMRKVFEPILRIG